MGEKKLHARHNALLAYLAYPPQFVLSHDRKSRYAAAAVSGNSIQQQYNKLLIHPKGGSSRLESRGASRRA